MRQPVKHEANPVLRRGAPGTPDAAANARSASPIGSRPCQYGRPVRASIGTPSRQPSARPASPGREASPGSTSQARRRTPFVPESSLVMYSLRGVMFRALIVSRPPLPVLTIGWESTIELAELMVTTAMVSVEPLKSNWPEPCAFALRVTVPLIWLLAELAA
jgi:hypothetical protein